MASAYLRRLIDPYLDRLLAELPAVLVVGPRAAGKTTTIARRAATVVRLDVPAEAVAFAADPDAALRELPEPVLLDEWQVVPGVLGAVRRAVDAAPRPARFLVTGSVRTDLEDAAWPGTGRLVRVPLYPMTVRELEGRSDKSFIRGLREGADLRGGSVATDLRGYVELALRSGFPYPALLTKSESVRQTWLESYLGDLLTHDVEQIEMPTTRRRDENRLRRYFEAYAVNSSGVVPHTTIYAAAQVAKATAEAYERLLTQLFVIETVPAWTANRLKRLVKFPKRYVVDAALVAAALRLDVNGILRDGDVLGRILDTFVAAQLRPELVVAEGSPRMFHLRTSGGEHEVDLIVEFGGGDIVAVEVKAAAAPTAHDARHLAWFRDEIGHRFLRGVVLHTGARTFELADRIEAVPISALWT